MFSMFYYVFGCFAYMYACVPHMHAGIQRSEALDPLGLEFQKVLRYHVGAGCWVLHLGFSVKGHLGSFCNIEH